MNAFHSSRAHSQPLAAATFCILAALMWGACSDDDSGGSPTGTNPDLCVDVRGTWSISIDGQSSLLDFEQTSDCAVSGQLIGGYMIDGYATPDSLYFSFGAPDVDPSERTWCAMQVVDKYLMRGTYIWFGDTGPVSLYGQDPKCGGVVDLTVSSGVTPRIDWQPECSVSFLLIESWDGGGDRWFVGDSDTNTLVPPLTYGVTPGGFPVEEVLPLEAGQTYHALVYRWLGEADGYLMVGYREFSP